MSVFEYNHGKCAAKVKWLLSQGNDFKQCTRKPKQGSLLCGIHMLKNPHGLVPGAAPEEEEPTALAQVHESENAAPQTPKSEESEALPEPEGLHEDNVWSCLDGVSMDDALGKDPSQDDHVDEEDDSGSMTSESEVGATHADEDHPDSKPGETGEEGAHENSSTLPPAKKPKLQTKGPMKYKFNFSHIAQHTELAQDTSKSVASLEELEKYSYFCVQMPPCSVPSHYKDLVETVAGPISLEEGMVQLYLTNLRFAGGPTNSKLHAPGHIQQLAKVWKNLQHGIKQSSLPHSQLPCWVTGHGPGITRLFRTWKKADVASEPGETKRTWITSEQVENYCISVILKDMQQMSSYIEIGEALLLRLQSARSHRFVNLAELKWSDTGSKAAASGEEEIPYVNIMCTKPLGSKTVQGLVQAKCKVELLITDAITKYLWNRWAGQPYEAEGIQTFVFPKQGKDSFLWNVQMPRAQHDRAVQTCALALKLPITAEAVYKYTSKSIRNGVAAEVSRTVRAALLGHNKVHGRSASSRMDINTYAPAEVLLEPGPVFGNEAEINTKLQEAVASHFLPIKHQLLCAMCGFPDCSCDSCKAKAGGSKWKLGHTCWLKGKKGPLPKQGPQESDIQLAWRSAAWQSFGVDDTPVFEDGKYTW